MSVFVYSAPSTVTHEQYCELELIGCTNIYLFAKYIRSLNYDILNLSIKIFPPSLSEILKFLKHLDIEYILTEHGHILLASFTNVDKIDEEIKILEQNGAIVRKTNFQ